MISTKEEQHSFQEPVVPRIDVVMPRADVISQETTDDATNADDITIDDVADEVDAKRVIESEEEESEKPLHIEDLNNDPSEAEKGIFDS